MIIADPGQDQEEFWKNFKTSHLFSVEGMVQVWFSSIFNYFDQFSFIFKKEILNNCFIRELTKQRNRDIDTYSIDYYLKKNLLI